MSLRKSLSKSIYGFATLAGLSGAAALTFNIDLNDDAKGIMQLGRAYERRMEQDAKVSRHDMYRNKVKLASGSRKPMPRLFI